MHIAMKGGSRGRLMGQRHSAKQFRHVINRALDAGEHVELDFDGMEITQSFADELIGALVLVRGTSVLQHISFRGCSESVKRIITFVVRDRAAQHLRATNYPMVGTPKSGSTSFDGYHSLHA
ncbi:STAS-like domain-containing protein, partial [Pseudomonas stutzeri]|nr:STAS-like domain-containing protein [Stutzerimonas stutzeri]